MKIALSLIFLFIFNCSSSNNHNTPSWYIKPQQNNSENIYGTAQGYSLEEATKSALADAAGRLISKISGQSTLLREQNRSDNNEEFRQQIKQNIEAIDFGNFRVSRSDKINNVFYAEIEINRRSFINDQKEKISFYDKQILDLQKNLVTKNLVQKRATLLKIIELSNKAILTGQILRGANVDINLENRFRSLANFNNQLNKINDKIEFYFDVETSSIKGKEIASIIRNALNKEQIKIAKTLDKSNPHQVVIKIKSSVSSAQIYEAFITKLKIDFENISNEKIIASNSIEVTGSSAISEEESRVAALKSLEEQITANKILQIIGITN